MPKANNRIQVAKDVFLHLTYDTRLGIWEARYVNGAGDQLGSIWYDTSRDHCLIFRPQTPVPPMTLGHGPRLVK